MAQKKIRTVGIIPSRYASTRFPGKPLAQILGKSLIQRTWECAKRCHSLDEICVATDDQRIYDHVKQFGGIVMMTPAECPTGSDRSAYVIQHKKEYFDAEIVVNIQGDEPCIDPTTIDTLVDLLKKDSNAVLSTPVAPLQDEKEALNPSVVKATFTPQGDALYFSRALIPSGKIGGMRDGVAYYRHIGIYAFRKDFLIKYGQLPLTPLQLAEDLEHLKVLEHGYKIKVAVVKEAHVGVDHPEDIQKIELLLCNQNTSLSQAEFAHR